MMMETNDSCTMHILLLSVHTDGPSETTTYQRFAAVLPHSLPTITLSTNYFSPRVFLFFVLLELSTSAFKTESKLLA